MADEVQSDEQRAVGEGATLGEAKWSALKQLEPRFPGLDADCASFEVVEEGDEAAGRPARVAAEVDVDAWQEASRRVPDEPAERVRALVTRVVQALDLHGSVDIDETGEAIVATVNGDDLGLLIGKHGATIDAVQHIAARAAFRGDDERKRVTIDAAGYRARRETVLHRAANRALADALAYGRPVELEPMGSQERRIVHTYLKDKPDVDTHSEGDEPDRRLVVTPVRQA